MMIVTIEQRQKRLAGGHEPRVKLAGFESQSAARFGS